nr:uncharacterized protein LOC111415036 [Onthophagus taurus]
MTPLLILLFVGCTQSLARVTNYNSDFDSYDSDLHDFGEDSESDLLEIDDRSIDYGDYYTREALPFTKTCEIKVHNNVTLRMPKSKHLEHYLNVTCESTDHYQHLGRPTSRQDFCVIKHQETDKNKEICKTQYIIKDHRRIGVGCIGCSIGLKYIKLD